MSWKGYALFLHVLALALIGTLALLFQAAPDLSLRGIAAWIANGLGAAAPSLLIGCLGFLYKPNRPLGFIVTSIAFFLFTLGGMMAD